MTGLLHFAFTRSIFEPVEVGKWIAHYAAACDREARHLAQMAKKESL